MRNNKYIFIIVATFVFILSMGTTYALFFAEVFGNDDAKDIITSTGLLKLTYNDGLELNEKYITKLVYY